MVVDTRHSLSAGAAAWDHMGAEWAAAVTRTVTLRPTGAAGVTEAVLTMARETEGAGKGRETAWCRQFVVTDDGVRWM